MLSPLVEKKVTMRSREGDELGFAFAMVRFKRKMYCSSGMMT